MHIGNNSDHYWSHLRVLQHANDFEEIDRKELQKLFRACLNGRRQAFDDFTVDKYFILYVWRLRLLSNHQ
jgi:hypothetical protein